MFIVLLFIMVEKCKYSANPQQGRGVMIDVVPGWCDRCDCCAAGGSAVL